MNNTQKMAISISQNEDHEIMDYLATIPAIKIMEDLKKDGHPKLALVDFT